MTERSYSMSTRTGPTIRTWFNGDGESMIALAPHFLAIADELRREGIKDPTMMQVDQRAKAYDKGEREMSWDLRTAIHDIDTRQRENGYADDAA
jgi:hypothetical protein